MVIDSFYIHASTCICLVFSWHLKVNSLQFKWTIIIVKHFQYGEHPEDASSDSEAPEDIPEVDESVAEDGDTDGGRSSETVSRADSESTVDTGDKHDIETIQTVE